METLKGIWQRSPREAPLIYFLSFMCCHHPQTGAGRGTQQLLNALNICAHQFAFVALLLHSFYISYILRPVLLPVSSCERWRERDDPTGFIMARSQLTGKCWQLKAAHTHTLSLTLTQTQTQTQCESIFLFESGWRFLSSFIILILQSMLKQ